LLIEIGKERPTLKRAMTIYIASILLWGIALTAQAQEYYGPTNFIAWNFDTVEQVSGWGNWFGGDFVSCEWDPSDASNNPNSGCIKLTVNCGTSFAQWVLWDGATPYYSPLSLIIYLYKLVI
jgi:hypothetical protein